MTHGSEKWMVKLHSYIFSWEAFLHFLVIGHNNAGRFPVGCPACMRTHPKMLCFPINCPGSPALWASVRTEIA